MSTLSRPAIALLREAQRRHRSLLSVGLEPCAEYLPKGFPPTVEGFERSLRLIIQATAGLACAYKFNLAFFEALGPKGVDLLYRVRDAIPDGPLVIADAKRSDIGTTAAKYAEAIYGSLGAHAATVNPLMGRDSVEPFLAHKDRLSFCLVLTSNPGAADFLLPGGLYETIARKLVEWSGGAGNLGFVVGATRAEHIADVRKAAPGVPFLIPGVGAQGGEVERTAGAGRDTGADPGLIFHVTRGVLPGADDDGDPGEIIRAKAERWRDAFNAAVAAGREVARAR